MPPEQPLAGEKPEAPDATARARISALDIFKVYTRISLSGFGGTLFWVRYVLVERFRKGALGPGELEHLAAIRDPQEFFR